MKRLLKKAASIGLCAVMAASVFVTGAVSTAVTTSALTTNDYYNSYTTVADIKNRDGCSAMQGMAVGSTYLYTVKIKDNNSGAVLQKTNKNTGATTNLTNSTGSIYTYLNHANDMDVTTIDGYSQLFVATMATGSNSLVRIKVNGSKATKSGGYTLMLNGAQKSVSGVAVESTTATSVNFLFKSGAQVYRGSVAKSATSGVINLSPVFTINTSSVKVNGSYVNLSSYTHQGVGYHDGKIYVPLWGGGAGKSNQAVIAVYDTYNASGSVKSDPFLSFRVTSGAYSGFEIESCDISSDGQMYFNVNRWTSSSGNYDAILRFNGFVANGFNPDGYTDAIGGGRGTVTVRGWTFDKDCAAMSIPVHVYIGGEAGNGEGHAITANTYRSDVNGSFGCGNYHGFEATIETSLRGSQPVYLYAINTRKGTNVMIGSGWVNIEEKQYSIYDYGIADIGSGFYANIVNVNANKNVALDLSNGNGNSIIYDRGSNLDHIWRFDRNADGSYKITNMSNGKCLDVNGAANADGANVQVWEDNGGAAQKWYIYNVNGRYALKAACSDRVLDVAGGSTANFANMQTWTFNGSGAQLFSIEQTGYGIYNHSIVDIGTGFTANIVNVNANKNVAIDANNNVIIFDRAGNTDHIWRFDRYADGSYKITNMANGKCLDVYGAANADGANVQLWDDNGGSAQKWYIYNVQGRYALKAACSDRVLDVAGGSTANYANMQTWTFNGTDAQLFTIEHAKAESDPPTISNVRITEVSNNGYRVTCDVSDASGISSVKFPTWTANNGQDDLIWHEGTISGNTATFYVSRNDHNGEFGTYYTHIYAYDPYGNQSCNGDTNVYIDGTAPTISNVRITEVSNNGYRVTCDVSDENGVTAVKFPTWTANNGQDDLIWHDGTVSGNTATFYVSRNDHNGEYGTYFTHIYAYDSFGNQSCNGDTNVYLENPTNIYDYGVVDLGSGFTANIVNTNANKNIAIDLSNANGNAIIYDRGNNTDHIWRFDRYADGSYKITNMYNGKCLDVSGGANADGANVQVWEDNGSAAQKWYIYNVNGSYALKPACSDRVLDVYGGSTANFANIQTWDFNASGAQLFSIEMCLNSIYDYSLADIGSGFTANIVNVNANKNVALDLSNTNGNAIIYDRGANADHIWRFDRYADGSYKITNAYNGKCLDVNGASGECGANVGVWEDNGSAAQKWYIYNVCGKYVLKPACSDRVLDVYGASTANFANIQTWDFNASGAQLFTIELV